MKCRTASKSEPGKPHGQARLLTVAEAARYLGTTVWAIRCLLWDGTLPQVRLGRRHLVDIRDLDGLIESLKTKELG